jgi:hypothetical protein
MSSAAAGGSYKTRFEGHQGEERVLAHLWTRGVRATLRTLIVQRVVGYQGRQLRIRGQSQLSAVIESMMILFRAAVSIAAHDIHESG